MYIADMALYLLDEDDVWDVLEFFEEEKYEYLNKRLEFDDETIDNHKNDEKHCNVESKIILNPKRNCDLCFVVFLFL
jgi:hypothetical protein